MSGSDASARFVYAPGLADFELGPSHPFKPLRLELTRSLLADAGLLRPDELIAPTPLSEKALLSVHSATYVEAVKAASRGKEVEDLYAFGLGTGDNPVFEGMHEAVLEICAATVTAFELVCSGKADMAVNLSGGLHHAMRAKASGFCVYNDIAVGIHRAVDHYGMRVAYVDLDAHHGDGVQEAFYETAEVMTVSLHESGRYLFPGTGHTYETGRGAGRGACVNMPLEPFTEDESFLEAFERVVPRAIEVFAPDLIVLQAGADMHRLDPLADLALSLEGMATAYERMVALAKATTGGKMVVTGGGGYDPYRTVPRAWARLWAALTGRAMPASLPASWLERWQRSSPVDLPRLSTDVVASSVPATRRALVSSHNRVVGQRLMATLEKIWQGRPVAR